MKYDFTSIIDRQGQDAMAVDGLGMYPGMSPSKPKGGFDFIPMWVADMNFPTVPTIPEAIIERAKHPAYGYFAPRDTYFDEIDLAGYLKKGKNTIAILLWYFGKEGFSYNPSGKAALFFDCNIDNTAMLYSDSSWRARVHPAYYTASHPHPNFRLPESNIGFDARYDIGTWWQQLEDSKGWQNAVICGVEGEAPWNKLHHRIIPFWKDSGLQNYEKVEQRYGNVVDTIIAYLPYNCHITPYMEIETKVAGEKVTMFTDYYRGGGSTAVRRNFTIK